MITLNPALENYIEINPPSKHICNMYEEGKLIIITDERSKINYDEKLINEANPSQLNHIPPKKGKSHWFEAKIIPTKYSDHVIYNFFPNDIWKGFAFKKQIMGFNNQIFDLVDKLFPKYNIIDNTQWTWRFTLTENENFHVDSYERGDHENHLLRVFYNLDINNRIWRVGPKVNQLLQLYKQPLLALEHPNRINHKLNFGLNWDELPYHEIHIPPKALMFCNTQIISHQIIWGKKLAAYSLIVDPKTMKSPHLNFVTQVREFLATR